MSNEIEALINETKEAPVRLNELIKEFVSLEENYNVVLTRLGHKKKVGQDKSKNSISYLVSQAKQASADFSQRYEDGSYLDGVVSETLSNWKNKKSQHNVLKWVLAGVFSVGGFYFGQIVAGLIVGAASWMLFHLLYGSQKDSIEKVEKILKSRGGVSYFDGTTRMALGAVSVELKQKITEERNRFKLQEQAKHDKHLKSLKENEKEAYTRQMNDERSFDKEEEQALDEINQKTELGLQKIKGEVESIVMQLDQLPESNNPKTIDWSDETVSIAKDLVATNYRIGEETVTIKISRKEHSISVPLLVPFLNRANLSLNWDGSNGFKKALTVSHNIIARTLLSLPSNKTKITFIDPLELGGNAGPFTPLLREVYGGMVHTQQDDIKKQLQVLTRSIENVIQRYLQDKFKDIAEYNVKTKEVPEPYRLLVVYNFPNGFNEESAKKLQNIMKSGPKAGVHTILVNDKKAKMPYGMEWSSFESDNIHQLNFS